MKHKLRSKKGFTMLESLAAVAIVALIMVAVGAGTTSSLSVYKQSTAISEASILSSSLFQAIADELRFAKDITTVSATDNNLSTFTSKNYGEKVSFSNTGGRVTIGGTDIVGEKAYTGLQARADILYSSGAFTVTITVTDPTRGGVTSGSAVFSVTPLNP